MISLARFDPADPWDPSDQPPLTWALRQIEGHWPGITRQLADGRHVVVLTTCDRGHQYTLPHAVAADGTVSPSIVCADHVRGCTFHDFARLADWTHGALARAGS